MIRFVKDLAATLLLRLFIVLLTPALILVGRSLRAKFLGMWGLFVVAFAAMLGLGLLAILTGLNVHFAGGPYFVSLATAFAVSYAVNFGLHVTESPRTAEFVEGWSAIGHGRAVGSDAEASVAVENDFLGFAAELFIQFNPMLTRGRAATIRHTLAADLEAMAERPELERLPSMLPWLISFHSLNPFGIAPDRQQAFVYCPPHDKGEKLPLVVVCHGHGGNPLVGCLPWADLADDLGFVVAFPTFGYGNWEHPAAAQAVVKCRRAVTERFAVDESRAVLAGISQGGCGVTRGATVAKWAGLVYVSPTMDGREFAADTAFAALWTGGPVLVAQGGRDINVKPKTVDAGVAALRAVGVAVTYVQDPDADHFYFFEKRDEFAERFRAWWPTAIPPAG